MKNRIQQLVFAVSGLVTLLGAMACSCSAGSAQESSTLVATSTNITSTLSSATTADTAALSKISPSLQMQIELRRAQLANPTAERLARMQSLGMNTTDLDIQRIYLYLHQSLTQTQIEELQSLGLTLYPDSWIPPVGDHPEGFLLADLPVDKLEDLAAKEYITRLDTAEGKVQPQISNSGENLD